MSFHEVLPGLWVGNILSLWAITALEEANITHILSVTTESVSLPRTLKAKGMIHKQIHVKDTADLHNCEVMLGHFDETFQFIQGCLSAQEPADGVKRGILVHCIAGVSRSITVVTAYLMRKCSLTREEAFQCVCRARPNANPNHGFQIILFAYGYDRPFAP